MPFSSIDKPSKYFNTVLYTGNGSARSLTGVNFKPDFVWIKSRSSASWWHQLQDIVRGATKRLVSNETVAEATDAQTLTSFDTDGFSLGTSTSYNNNGDTYVAWNWLASNTSGSSNTSGTITSTVSANTTSGFSVVKYTGTGSLGTVGHGLGVAPKMIIIKRYDGGDGGQWNVYHQSLGNTKVIYLNSTAVPDTTATRWNNTSPTSSVFTVNTSGDINNSGSNHIAYCFAEVKGFSKAFSYTGNGSSDGTFVYCGFTPAFIMMRRTDASGYDWGMMDNKRDTYNETYKTLWANLSNSEYTTTGSTGMATDFLSNGFKMRGTNGENNASGANYIGIAFASNPFVSSKGVAVTAR